jgi:acetyl-CoA carboxylase biotin carboxyl carrier protein
MRPRRDPNAESSQQRESTSVLTFEQIKELIELVAQRKLQGLEVERSGFRLKIDGHSAARAVQAAAPGSAPGEAPPAAPPEPLPAAGSPPGAGAAASGPAPEEEGEAGEAELPAGAQVVKSPIVGTFYRSPAPDADPFVEVGDSVKKGQVLCIVEAMKLMNEIESEASGTILEVYPENAQPVEFGEPLFAIKPS